MKNFATESERPGTDRFDVVVVEVPSRALQAAAAVYEDISPGVADGYAKYVLRKELPRKVASYLDRTKADDVAARFRELGAEVVVKPSKRKTSHSKILSVLSWIFAFSVFVLPIAFCGYCTYGTVWKLGGDGSRSSPHDPNMAFFACQDFVKERLRAPSTAEWGSFKTPTRLRDRRYRIDSYVDAQNSFGAQVRTEFTCVVRYQPADDTWRLESLKTQ